MKIAVIGTGYVGLPTGLGLASFGHQVWCVDKIPERVSLLQSGISPLFEEGLPELLTQTIKEQTIHFTTNTQQAVQEADVVILAVGTPPHPITKEADLSYIYAAVKEVAPFLKQGSVLATKSTVPVGTGDEIEKIISKENPQVSCDVVSLPEFLREGFSVYDFFNPDRIIIGTNSAHAKEVLLKLYEPFAQKTKILCVKRRSSEAIKYASNAFLAVKIHYINEIANLCEKIGADITEVATGMGLDKRIGSKFLQAGPGFGGSCFPKDTNAVAYLARKNGVDLSLIETAIKGNDNRKKEMAERIITALPEKENPVIACLGLAFKGGTDDCRESPAVQIIASLLAHPVKVVVFDPKAMENAQKILQDQVTYATDMYSVAQDADVLVAC